jgi:hypothetical protein
VISEIVVNSAAVWYLGSGQKLVPETEKEVNSGADILEEGHNRDDSRWRNVNGKLVLPDAELLDVFRQTRQKVSTILVHCLSLLGILVRWIDNRRFEFSDV